MSVFITVGPSLPQAWPGDEYSVTLPTHNANYVLNGLNTNIANSTVSFLAL
jgi:hypothetical protein